MVIDGALDIRFIATPDSSNLFGVWWQTNDLSPHVSAYQADGKLVYQADGTSLMNMSVPTVVDFAAEGQLIHSADGGLALLYGVYGDYTALIDAHNQVTRLPIEYWGDVTWKRCD